MAKEETLDSTITGFSKMNDDAKRMVELFEEYTEDELIETDILSVIMNYYQLFMTFLEYEDYLEEFGWDGGSFEPETVEWGNAVGNEVEW